MADTRAPAGIDFGRTAADYGRFRAGFPEAFFWRLRHRGIGLAGQRALDLGTGTGTIARGLARGGAAVTGLDRSRDLIGEARRLDTAAGLAVAYVEAVAEDTGFGDGAFDVVSAGQCWHWFKRDIAAAEAFRILRPGGRIVLGHFDWLPRPGNVVAATERLILAHNPQWRGAGGNGLGYVRWVADLEGAGFTGIEIETFDIDQSYSREAWRGRIRASAGIAASLPADAVARFDAEHAALLAKQFPRDPLAVPHRVFMLLATRP